MAAKERREHKERGPRGDGQSRDTQEAAGCRFDGPVGKLPEGFTRLCSITLIDTAVTEDGAKRLHKALPNAGISAVPAAANRPHSHCRCRKDRNREAEDSNSHYSPLISVD